MFASCVGGLVFAYHFALNIWYQVGEALLHIRDKRLYRSTHKTFEEYCRERWDFSRRRAYQLLDAAGVFENVKNFSHLPQYESQVAPLTSLEPEAQGIVWDVVQQTAPNGLKSQVLSGS